MHQTAETLAMVAGDIACNNEAIKQTQALIKEEQEMRTITKSKKGLTLVEIMGVLAVIVILASVCGIALIGVVKNLPWEELIGENPFVAEHAQTEVQ